MPVPRAESECKRLSLTTVAVSTCQKQTECSNTCPRQWSLPQFPHTNHGSMYMTQKLPTCVPSGVLQH